ncbi:TetR family transcriptional regulator [Streptomyces sp. NPDC097619]|uniref:TetR/AcrR family transcriptional regulator n=1 Tax=Streptomyces sp. NPDC097619 TaxID=3157228 RepID=UPI0033214202
MSPTGPAAPTPKGTRRRAELLAAAERVLAGEGGAELTLRAVAAEAGVRIGHLQYYFPARADLIAALLEQVLSGALARVAAVCPDPATAGNGPAEDAAVLDAVLLADHEDARLVRMFTEIWALAAREESAARAVREFYAAYTRHVAEFMARRSPGAPPAEFESRAAAFVMLIEGASLFRSGIAGRPGPGAEAELRRLALGLLAPPGA